MTLIAAVGVNDELPPDLAVAIDALTPLDIDDLWRVSQSQPSMEDKSLLDTFVEKRRHQAPTPDEHRLLADVIDRYDRVMVLRAEAVALLKQRGVDIGELVARA